MEEELKQKLDTLNEDILGGIDEVAAAIESAEDRRQLAAGQLVKTLAQRYADLLDEVPDGEQDRVERSVGRRITDLRRAAMQLTRRDSGAKAERAHDAGSVPFLLQRTPPRTIVPGRAAPEAGKLTVGGEVDAWCGKCREIRTHNIVAMVGGDPKQVICQVCNSRHGYRTEVSTRGAKEAAPIRTDFSPSRGPRPEDREAARRQEAKRLLQKELAEATDPRPFDPKARYKAGEIILHPEHGKGKIENVLKGSMLVRFLEGLRPVNMG